MQSAYIINDRTGKPYAVVGILAGGTEFYPIADSAVSWASWMTQDFAAKKITKEQLSVTLDNSMSLEGPMPANRTNKAKIDELIKKAKKVPKGESDKEEMEQTEEKSLVPVLSLMDVRLDALENSDWRNAVNFKAKSLLTDSNKSTFAYEVKRTRAAWDPTLSIPGTDRQGGWRCPPGTRYGGQITDRFGRNCGWGVARRLANEISDLGERLENVGDQRRERRVNRRNERVARRLVEGGRVERAARAVGNALETRPERERRPGVVERAAGRLGDILDTTAPRKPNKPGRQRRGENNRGGILERAAGRLAEALESDDSPVRPAPRRPRPARPRQPRRPREERDAPKRPQANRRPARPVDNVSKTPVPAGAPQAGETLEQYKTRKYNEHQQRVREIRDAGGNAGFLKREEWDEFHGPRVEENWNRAQERNAGRGARRTATDAGAARTASRRPRPADEPDAVQPPRRQRRPFNAPGQRGLTDEAAARRKRAAMERDNNKRHKLVKHNDKYYVVEDSEVARAQAAGANLDVVNEPPRPGPRPAPAPPAGGDRPSTPSRPPSGGRRGRRKSDPNGAEALDNDNKLGPVGPDGLPNWGGVAVGNKGINTKEDAAQHVASGGDIADVPDDFVIEALNANSGPGKRFKREQATGGVNGIPGNMHLYEDSTNGKKYYTKYEKRRVADGEEIREIVGNNIAARLGFPVGEFRFAGPATRDRHGPLRPILFEHAGNYVQGQYRKGEVENAVKVVAEDKVRATVLDYLILNVDRHRSNFFVVKQGNKHRFVPIDPSLGFEPGEGYGSFQGPHADRAGMRRWLESHRGGGRNAMLGQLRSDFQAGRVTKQEVAQEIERLQKNLREAQDRLAFTEFARGAQGAVVGNPEAEKLIDNPQKRIDFFIGQNAGRLADMILGN
jgi:hypothetical protein